MTEEPKTGSSCWPLFHTWGKWTVIEEAYKPVYGNDPHSGELRIVSARVCLQRKECLLCGKVKLRKEIAV